MAQMLSMAIKQPFTSNLFTNYENMLYLNTAPHLLFETTMLLQLFWLVDTLHFQSQCSELESEVWIISKVDSEGS